jgi:hypothetical protein
VPAKWVLMQTANADRSSCVEALSLGAIAPCLLSQLHFFFFFFTGKVSFGNIWASLIGPFGHNSQSRTLAPVSLRVELGKYM